MFQDQRGFTVASVSASELTELTEFRCWVEEIALRRSMAAATAEWEETLVVLCHRLIRTERSVSSDGYAENLVWEKVHRSFHPLCYRHAAPARSGPSAINSPTSCTVIARFPER